MPTDATHPQVFRSTFWRGVALLWVPVLAYAVYDVARRDFPASGWTALAVMAAITVVVYVVGWRPAVLAGDQGVVVRNPFRTTTIPWNAVRQIDVTDALRVHTDRGIVRAWAVDRGGAASNMLRGMGRRRMAVGGLERGAVEAMARQSPADHAVASMIDIWHRQRGRVKGAVDVQWAWPELVSLVVLAAVAAVLVAT